MALAHVGDALAAPVHTEPHWLQCSTLLFRFVSHPFESFPSQLPKGALQEATWHSPAAHASVALASWHAFPHAPQCATLVLRSVSHATDGLPSHSPKPVGQFETMHWPFKHTWVPPSGSHCVGHSPQCCTSACKFASHPSPSCPLQSAYWLLHESIPQTPASHFAVAWANEHPVPHMPQFAGSAPVFTSHPFASLPSQSVQPTSHEPIEHAPFMHLGSACP
jgi:hypothetical protein